MKVKELVEIFENLNGEKAVFIIVDGNFYRELKCEDIKIIDRLYIAKGYLFNPLNTKVLGQKENIANDLEN